MDFSDEVARLWERPAEEFLTGDLGVTPLAVLGQLPEGVPLEEALTTVARRLSERLEKEAGPDRREKLMIKALLLAGLRVRRDVAGKIFRGVLAMEESDTFLMILDEGKERATRKYILLLGGDHLGEANESVKAALKQITDLDRLERILRQSPRAASWDDLLRTP